jgi:pimeloyl-ACP methyl ester carboxylesterase
MSKPSSAPSSTAAFPTLQQHSGMLHAGGHALDYRWLQPVDPAWQQRPLLVWLHQGLGSSTMWRDFPEQLMLRTGCASLIYSRYGHGQSDAMAEPRPPQFMDIEGVQVLPQVLDWLMRSPMLSDLRVATRAAGTPLPPVILIGHSDGGTSVLAYLGARGAQPGQTDQQQTDQRSPDVCGAIVVAPHTEDEAMTWQAIARHRAAWSDGVLRGKLARYHRDVDGMFLAWADVWLKPEMRGWHMRDRLPHIGVPVLAVQGENDDHGGPVHVRNIAAMSPSPVQLELLPGCGHDPFREQSAHMLALCQQFIAQHGGTR